LYNPGLPKYSDKLLRENTWKAIGDEMEVDGEFNENI
jgi:hypothetical protein